MITYIFIFLIFLWIFPFLLEKHRIMFMINTITMTLIYFINDIDSTAIPDEVLKVSFLMSMIITGLFLMTYFYSAENIEEKK